MSAPRVPVLLVVTLALVACAGAAPPEPALCPAPSRPPSAPVRARRQARVTAVERGADEVLRVPDSAVMLDPTGAVVFVFEGGRARRRTVIPAAHEGDRRALVGGVREGERVLVDPQGLYDGEAIDAVE